MNLGFMWETLCVNSTNNHLAMENENYEAQFLSFRNELSSFVFRLLTNKQNTEDIVQDTYIKAFEKLDSFRKEASFKTWVFTIATNLSKTFLKQKSRWVENAQDYGANLHVKSPPHFERFLTVFNSSPEKEYEVKEHISYCFNCINKTLKLDQQICLLLKEVYAFKLQEIIAITGLTEGKAKHALADARKNMVRIFDDRCAFVNKKGACHQCTSLKGLLNPKQDAHIKANEIQLVKKGESANKDYLLDLRLDLVRSIDPLNSVNTLIHTYMLESCESWVEEGKAKKVLEKPSKNKA